MQMEVSLVLNQTSLKFFVKMKKKFKIFKIQRTNLKTGLEIPSKTKKGLKVPFEIKN
jgi:hypothetical protein